MHAGVNKLCVVTLANKIHTLVDHFKKEKYNNCEIFYVIQKKEQSMWEAIKTSFPYTEDVTLFSMTDTLFNIDSFSKYLSLEPHPSFALGTFETQMAERFGVITNGKVCDKPVNYPSGKYLAWGTMIWSKPVVEEWLRWEPGDGAEAINIAVEQFGLHTFPLDYYYDFASWSDYEAWIRRAGSNPHSPE